ncbi:MAG: arylsulfatase [Cyclobacteriaceae bacterium]
MKYILLFLATLFFSGGLPEDPGKETLTQRKASRPNIIIILADDLGYGDVGYYGSDIKTPNLDQLAQEGVILNRFYVTPVCSPTRAGLLTGRYPDRFGLRQTVIPPWRNFGVDTSEVFLPEMLAEVGYKHRAMLGKWHLGHSQLAYHPLQRGFTHFYGHFNGAIDYFTHKREGELDWHNDYQPSYDEGYTTDLLSQEAAKCIRQYQGESPFFMYVAYNAPHVPLQAKEEDLLQYGFDKNKPLFSDKDGYGAQGRGNTRSQTYAAMVTALDRGIGQIMQTLDELGIEENTLLLFHSDNGPDPGQGGSSGPLRGHKFQEWEGGVRVPALVRWPDGFSGGRSSNQVMGYVDVMPTIMEITGIQAKDNKPLDGMSMLPVWNGSEQQVDRNFYLGSGAMVNNRWKLVKATGENNNMDIQHDMLFNIEEDIDESSDQQQAYPKRYHELNEIVSEFEAIESANEVPPYQQGREGFKAPKEWTIDY